MVEEVICDIQVEDARDCGIFLPVLLWLLACLVRIHKHPIRGLHSKELRFLMVCTRKLQAYPLESCLDDCSLKTDPEQLSPIQTLPQFLARTDWEKDTSCFQTLLTGEIGHVAMLSVMMLIINFFSRMPQMVSWNSLIVLAFTFRSLMHFWLLFVLGERYGYKSILFACAYPFISTIY